MSFFTKMRVNQLSASYGTTTGKIQDQQAAAPTGSYSSGGLDEILSHLASSIKRIHGADSFSESHAGHFQQQLVVSGVMRPDAAASNRDLGGGTGSSWRDLYLHGDIKFTDASVIDVAAGDLTMDLAADLIIDVDGGDVILKDDSTEFGRLTNASSDLVLAASVADKDILFKGVDDSSSITALQLDMSDGGRAVFLNDVRVGVDAEVLGSLKLGADVNEFTISETSDDITMKVEQQDKDLFIKGNDGGAEVTALSFDMSDAGRAAFGNDVRVGVDLEVLGVLKVGAGANEFTITESTDNIVMKVEQQDKDLTIAGNDGGNNVNALAFDMSDGGKATFAGGVVVGGDLTVNGTTTTVNSTVTTIDDPLIVLGDGNSTDAKDLGLVFVRSSNNMGVIFDESDDTFKVADLGSEDGTTSGNISSVTPTNFMAGKIMIDSAADSIDLVGDDLKIVAAGNMAIQTNGQLVLSASHFLPSADASKDLGSATVGWNDLHLGSGGVINLDGGDVTLTHSAGKVTLGGDDTVEFDFGNHEMTNVDIDSGAIDGTVIGAASPQNGTFQAVVGTSLDINGAADISGDLTLSAGGDGALRFSAASSIKILDNSSTSLVIEEADNAYMTFDSTDNAEKILVSKMLDINGQELVLDADADTSIHANTDDQIDFKLGGSDIYVMKAAALEPGSDGAIDLGSQTKEWKDLYIDGIAYIDQLRADQLGAALDCNSQAMTNVNIDTGDVELVTLNIDGGTDIGADLADADLLIVDDGGNGTNRKATMNRVADYVFSKVQKQHMLITGAGVGPNQDVTFNFNIFEGDGAGGVSYGAANAKYREIYVNGQLVMEGQDAAANRDFYPGTTADDIKFEFALAQGDVVTAIVRRNFANS